VPAEGLTPEQIRELVGRFGSLEAAVEEARTRPGFGDELRQIAAAQMLALSHPEDARGLNESYMRVVYAAVGGEPRTDQPTRRSQLGRRDKDVADAEANRGARIYAKDRTRTPYAVHQLYRRQVENGDPPVTYDATTGPHRSRTMVGYLMTAIDEGWLPWDPAGNELRISDEPRKVRHPLPQPL
jgi:hypothetical protein